MNKKISIILPARNESVSLEKLIPELKQEFSNIEIIIVNDGSTDQTLEVAQKHDVQIVNHPYPKGNGAAVKSGARAATGDILVFMDADGQHQPKEIQKLLAKMVQGYDMVVGCRSNKAQANWMRLILNKVYNFLASWITAQKIYDLTSGFRVVDAMKFKEFLHLLPNGFSYPTTITMAFFRAGYSISYTNVDVLQRTGTSHIRPIKDGVRFFLIIFKVGTLYSPLKFFVPISFIVFITGVSYYLYTFFTQGRFTNMSALLITTSLLIFFIGIVSEQLTMLFYRDKK
jgi:glycosyltransferase involved in cell wall biosynthesis